MWYNIIMEKSPILLFFHVVINNPVKIIFLRRYVFMKKTTDFNGILTAWEAERETLENLISQTEFNDLWVDSGVENIVNVELSPDNYDELQDEILKMLEYCFETSYEGIDEQLRRKYYCDLEAQLEDEPENWDLLQQIEDGLLPIEEWPNYFKYLEEVKEAKENFDASESVQELRQLQEEWKNYIHSPKADLTAVDWSVPENRSAFLKWLSEYDSEPENEFFRNLDYSECLEYEDFCLFAPYYIYMDEDGLMSENITGKFSDIRFLLNHLETFDGCMVFQYIINRIGIVYAINKYPKEMLMLISSDYYSNISGCEGEIIQHIYDYNIPESLKDDYSKVFVVLKAEHEVNNR